MAIWRALEIHAIDLLAAPGLLVDAGKIVQQPEQQADEIRALDVPVANLIFMLGSSFSDRALNHPDPAVRARNAEDFRAIVEFCHRCEIPSITVLPGVDQPGWSREQSLAVSARAMNELASVAEEKGIALLFEAHVQSVLESPADTLCFLEANPRLKLTLDYSHFVWHGHAQQEIDCLAPYTGHVHLRQGAPKMLQARWDEGVIDFGEVVRVLKRAGFSGYCAFEYEHDAWLGNNNVDVITETIKMRDLVKPLLA